MKFEKNHKIQLCEHELRVLLQKLLDNNYGITAEWIFDYMAHSGVEAKISPEINKLTMQEFLELK